MVPKGYDGVVFGVMDYRGEPSSMWKQDPATYVMYRLPATN